MTTGALSKSSEITAVPCYRLELGALAFFGVPQDLVTQSPVYDYRFVSQFSQHNPASP